MVNFDLSPQQNALRIAAKGFATTYLKDARSRYEGTTNVTPSERFRSLRPVYETASKLGLIKGLIPLALGATGGTLIESALITEEFYAVDTSSSLTILGTGLGLTPLILAGSSEQQNKYLEPFLRQDGSSPLASFVFSEPQGSANFVTPGTDGFRTTATFDQEREEFVISGEKIWATNSGGWDDRGADVQCLVCRVVDPAQIPDETVHRARNQTAIIIVTRDDIATNDPEAFQVLDHPKTLGHTGVNGPHIRYSNLRVPASNLLAPPGRGADIVDLTFTGSAALVCAMGVGIMRQTFERALEWTKSEKRGGEEATIEKQSVADLLIKIKIRCETSRMICWKACNALGKSSFANELAYEAKIFGSESAVESVLDAINLVGVSAYNHNMPFAALLNDAIVLPIFDGGNVGIRRRQIETLFKHVDYKPWESTFGSEA